MNPWGWLYHARKLAMNENEWTNERTAERASAHISLALYKHSLFILSRVIKFKLLSYFFGLLCSLSLCSSAVLFIQVYTTAKIPCTCSMPNYS